MKLKNLFHIISIIFLTFYGCGQAEREQTSATGISLRLSIDSAAVELYNIPVYIIEEFRSDSLEVSQWENFFAIYEEPADPELRDLQTPIEGVYEIRDSVVRFVPAAAFKAGGIYFARCYAKKLLQEPQDLISSRKLPYTEALVEYKFRILK